ncbi:MAG: Ig-like domain-containing protein, partial [Roseicyclus sp.]
MAAGLGGLSLVLPTAMVASAQEQVQVDVSTIDGVVSAEIAQNGDLLITLENGQQVRIDASGFEIAADGSYIVPDVTADTIALAAVDAAAGSSVAEGGAGMGGLALLGGLAVAAGGGGGGGGGVAPTPELAFVVDGYLSGAQVFGDANANGIFDTGETETTTAADGSFDSSLFAADVPLIAVGGVDISTGEAFTGTLKAPAGSTVVTPLTTLVQAVIASDTTGTPPTAAEAAASVASSLGLSGDLLNDDPAALAEEGDLSQLQAAAKIAAVVNLVSASAPSDPDGAADAVLAALAEDLTDGEGGDPFDDPNALNTALAAAGDAIEVSVTDLAEALVGAAAQIDGASDLDGLEGAQTVVQGTLTQAVVQSVGDSDGTSALSDANDDTELFENVVPLRPVLDASLAGQSLDLNAASEASITIFGTGQPGSTVTVTLGDASGSDVVDGSGDWSVTLTGANFPSDGDVSTTITATKDVGGVQVVSGATLNSISYQIDTTPPAPPSSITLNESEVDGVVNDAEAGSGSISGVADPNATVRLAPATGTAIETTADGSGNFSFDLTFDLSQGENTVQITQTDQAGNVSEATGFTFDVDTIAPAGTLAVVETDGVVDVSEAADGVQFSGTGEDGATVSVYIQPDGEARQLLGTTTVSGGTWTFTTETPADGDYQVSVEVTDAALNLTTADRDFTVDATAPELSDITTDKAALVGADDTTPVTVSGSVSGATSVSVAFLDGSDEVVASTDAVLSGGTFSAELDLSGLGDGSYSLRVTAGDGTNETTQTTASAITFDRTPPATPSIDVIAGDDVVEGAELASNVVISGSG